MKSVPFLKEIAALLLQPEVYNLQETCVVFPNKRARLYLGKYIGELTDKPVWAPQYLTISELMEKASGYLYADRLTLLFELYRVYIEVSGSGESFDTFYPYSETLLADFDEIDKYLVDAADLFGNLAGLKSIEGRFNYLTPEQIELIRKFWNTFDPENISDGQKTFLSLWELLPDVYQGLRNRLHGEKLAYEGMAYRKAVESISDFVNTTGFDYRKYLFVGFNALNTCEEKLFRHLKNLGLAEFFWDYDSWYTNNDIHEAGFFIRNNLKNFPSPRSINPENLLDSDKRVFFVPVSSNTGQAAMLPRIFDTLGIAGEKDKDTALVLADENLLLPVLYAIPGYVKDVNVTMGYPLAGSLVFNLVDSLYELVRNSKTDQQGDTLWYYKDVLAVLNNPLLKSGYNELAESIRQKVLDHNLVYLQKKDLFPDTDHDIIFSGLLSSAGVESYLTEVIASVMRQMASQDKDQGSADPVQLEILFQVYTFLTRLDDLLTSHDIHPGMDTLFRLIRKMMRTMHLPFSGEPLAGLQVLGLLETRTLDFDNVILLSANEGILPRISNASSFIPYNIRAGFSMPTPEHYDAISAYHFYRLIQRAKNIALVYDSSSGGLHTGERSRFLHQIAYEMTLKVTEIFPQATIARIPVKPIVMHKTGAVAAALQGYLGKDGKLLSPSAINEFLNCPLKFCFHHLLDLPQPTEVAEEVDARLLGNLLHKAMKILYSGFGTKPVTRELLEASLKEERSIDMALDKAFQEELFGISEGTGLRKVEGYNLIIRQVIRTYIHQLVRAEMESEPFSIIGLEERYKTAFHLSVDGSPVELQIGGIIDRIDLRQGSTFIIDYKTGTVKNSFTTIESLFNSEDRLRNDAVFQVLLYAHMYDELYPGNNIVPGLYFIRASHSGDFSCLIKHTARKETLNSYASVKQEFEPLLRQNLIRMFSSGEPFTQTQNLKVCGYCAYAAICRR
ncbi:MAG: PD-(D/E)XK nuclease family protein [Bacteroidales bacterium]|nr:PD-(D/E)XK nuclease family protein [Bacteroidales bacterium]